MAKTAKWLSGSWQRDFERKDISRVHESNGLTSIFVVHDWCVFPVKEKLTWRHSW